ncbi:MAG: CoA transferase [Frankiales bacterium]|nr:CoA transferase [Frankiales bacterium]
MYDVMQGVKVIECAEHTFVPAAAMILADWGADVIKVERVQGGGDAARNMAAIQRPGLRSNPFFEAANRGKRSIGLDLTQEAGREQLHALLADADVFVTNLREGALGKLGITAAELTARYPRLVYASGTGYGTSGPMAGDGGFDQASSWCRSGSAYVQSNQLGTFPPNQPGSVGDLNGGATLAGAISAALFRRERTGQGAVIDHSLYAMGGYIMSQSLAAASLGWVGSTQPQPREQAGEPMSNFYRTQDGRWLFLCLLYPQWWADFAEHVGRPEWITDPRFAEQPARAKNNVELIAELDAIFRTRTLAEWEVALADLIGVWAPCKSPAEVLEDEQALAAGVVVPVTFREGDETYLTSPAPCQFDGKPIGELRSAPRFAEDTDDVMRGLGLTDAQIAELRERGVVV